MKKVINGKKYDTDTAKKLGEYWNGLSRSDFNWLSEELYVKKTGEYFVYGEGGPMTQYAERCGDMWAGGKAIKPISEAEAKEWAENFLTADEYEQAFGEVEE